MKTASGETIPIRAEGPVIKVEWAKKHFQGLEIELRGFLDANPYDFITEFDVNRSEHVVKARIPAPVPKAIGAHIGCIVHNLRSSLDLLTWQLVEAGGGTPGRETAFPIRGSKKALETDLPAMIKGAPDGTADIIERLEPYKGGKGHALWLLNKLAIADKHHLLVPVAGLFPERDGTIQENWPDREGVKITKITYPRVFPLEDGTEVFRHPGNAEMKVKFDGPIYITFREPKVVEGEPIVRTLQEFGEFVTATIYAFFTLL